MKNKVAKFIKALGGIPHYSGHTKTMYISEADHVYSATAALIEDAALTRFGYGLPFKIATNL